MTKKPQNGTSFSQKKKGNGERGFLAVWLHLLRECRPHAAQIVLALIAVLLATALTILAPNKLAQLTDLVQTSMETGVDMAQFMHLAGITLLIFLLSALFSGVGRFLMSGLTQHVSHHIRLHVFKKINRMDVQRCEHAAFGDVLSRTVNDVDTVGHALHEAMSELIPALAMLFGSLLMMALTNLVLTAVAVLATGIGFAAMLFIMSRSQGYFERQQRYLGEMNAHVEEIYTAHGTVRSCDGEHAVRETFSALNRRLEESSHHARFLSSLLSPLLSFAANFGHLAVCVAGALLALNGHVSFGVIVAFMFFVHHFSHPFAEIAVQMQALQSAAAAGARVYEFLEEEEEAPLVPTASLEATRGGVTFTDVGFHYADGERAVVHDFSLDVAPGMHVAVLGPEGSGKTTLGRLLTGLYTPTRGEIGIDGVPISSLSREELHAQFSFVPQAPWIFEGTVWENLVYCTEGVPEEQVREVCRETGLDDFISSLPNGYATVLGQGVTLSEGRRQQLGIARALLQGRPMYILDEAMTALDPITEATMLRVLEKRTKGHTTFFISHRPLSVRHADLILVMEEGAITERGTHEELMKRDGYYARLCRAAFH